MRRIRLQHGVHSRKTEFLRPGLPGWISSGPSGQATRGAHSVGLLPDPKEAATDRRDPEIGLYLVPEIRRR